MIIQKGALTEGTKICISYPVHVLDVGPDAEWWEPLDGLMEVSFYVSERLAYQLVQRFGEIFYVINCRHQCKIPVNVVSVETRTNGRTNKIRLRQVGRPVPFSMPPHHPNCRCVVSVVGRGVGLGAQTEGGQMKIPPTTQSLEAEASIKGVLGTVERLMRSGARVDISKDLPMDGSSFDSVYGLRGCPVTTITVKGKDEGMTVPTIPKLWDVPLDHLCQPPYGRSPLSRAYEKLDAMMTGTLESGTLETTHKENKAMMDKKTLKANRFYVGNEQVLRNGWGKPTLAEAVELAKRLQEETGDDQFVVQIVRVVKKKEQPVVVEAVK